VWQDAVYRPLLERQMISKEIAIEIRLGFIRKVYGILLSMLLLTIGVAVMLNQYLSQNGVVNTALVAKNTWLLFFALAVIVTCLCTMACAESWARQFPNNYIVLLIFSWAMGVMVAFATLLFSWQTVLLAVVATGVIVIFLTAYSYFATTDFTGHAPYLMVCLFVLLFFGLTLMILSVCGVFINVLYMFYSFLATVLFSFFLVYDTQLILGEHKGHKMQFSIDDYAFAALSLYTDVINIFLAILQCLGNRGRP